MGVRPTEGARIGHFTEDDISGLHGYEEMVAFPDVEHPSCLSWDDDATEVIDLPCNSGFHRRVTLPIGVGW